MKILSTKKYNERFGETEKKTPSRKIVEEDGKTYEVEYTVTYKKNMRGSSPADVQNTIKKEHDGNQVSFRYTKEIESVNEDMQAPPAPLDEDAGMTGIINNLIVDEYEAIDGYNGAIQTANVLGYQEVINVLSDISNEENIHIGQLQELLKTFSEQAKSAKQGEEEAKRQLSEPPVEDVFGDDISSFTEYNVDDDIGDVDDEIIGIETYM